MNLNAIIIYDIEWTSIKYSEKYGINSQSIRKKRNCEFLTNFFGYFRVMWINHLMTKSHSQHKKLFGETRSIFAWIPNWYLIYVMFLSNKLTTLHSDQISISSFVFRRQLKNLFNWASNLLEVLNSFTRKYIWMNGNDAIYTIILIFLHSKFSFS